MPANDFSGTDSSGLCYSPCTFSFSVSRMCDIGKRNIAGRQHSCTKSMQKLQQRSLRML